MLPILVPHNLAARYLAISVFIGLGLANTIRPGERISPEIAAQLKEKFSGGAATATDAQKKAAEAAKSDSPLMQAVKQGNPLLMHYHV